MRTKKVPGLEIKVPKGDAFAFVNLGELNKLATYKPRPTDTKKKIVEFQVLTALEAQNNQRKIISEK